MAVLQPPDDDPYLLFKQALDTPGTGYSTTKRAALRMHSNGGAAAVADTLVARLFEAFQPRWWAQPARPTPNNWRWRRPDELSNDAGAADPEPADRHDEVRLERALVRAAGLGSWTFQMSTMSGLVDEHAHKRRAIDLVHRVAPGHFEFIELKTRSDNPLFAAFEILGYGLAWCRARQHPGQHRELHRANDRRRGVPDDADHVLDARRIDLVVWAPPAFYALPGASGRYELDEFAASIDSGLEQVVAAVPGVERMTFGFREFVDAKALIELAKTAAGE